MLVRSDLSPGMQLAQAAHGIAEFARDHPDAFEAWMRDSNYIVVLAIPDEFHLRIWADAFGDEATLVYEPDISEHTVLVIQPTQHWRKLSHLPLAGKEAVLV